MHITTPSIVKFIQPVKEAIKIDDIDKVFTKYDGYLEFPNGKKASNMLDAFIAATGTNVIDYKA